MAGLNTVLNNISTVSVSGSLYTIASNGFISDDCSISLSEGIEKRILETSINNIISLIYYHYKSFLSSYILTTHYSMMILIKMFMLKKW